MYNFEKWRIKKKDSKKSSPQKSWSFYKSSSLLLRCILCGRIIQCIKPKTVWIQCGNLNVRVNSSLMRQLQLLEYFCKPEKCFLIISCLISQVITSSKILKDYDARHPCLYHNLSQEHPVLCYLWVFVEVIGLRFAPIIIRVSKN